MTEEVAQAIIDYPTKIKLTGITNIPALPFISKPKFTSGNPYNLILTPEILNGQVNSIYITYYGGIDTENPRNIQLFLPPIEDFKGMYPDFKLFISNLSQDGSNITVNSVRYLRHKPPYDTNDYEARYTDTIDGSVNVEIQAGTSVYEFKVSTEVDRDKSLFFNKKSGIWSAMSKPTN